MAPRSLTWQAVWRRRLARHALIVPAPKQHLVEVVRAVCGIHAQVMPAAELAIGVRVADVTRQDVRNALWQQRSLVKTYGPRGTVHLFAADDLPLWTAALGGRADPREERRLSQHGLPPAQARAVVAAIGEALDGQCLTREELGGAVARIAGAWATDAVSPAFGGHTPRWQMALGAAARAGVLCFGPPQGTRVTFVRPDQWVADWHVIDETGALATVFRRYLAAYGPATPRDFARWFGLDTRAAQELQHELAGDLQRVDIEGERAWLLAADAEEGWTDRKPRVQLLPYFDCYVVGCHPRAQLVSPAWQKRVLPHGAAGTVPVVLVNGVVAGIWQRTRSGHRMELRVEVDPPLSVGDQAELEAAAARIGEIEGVAPTVVLGTVEAQPHL